MPPTLSTPGGARRFVLLMMMVAACGHFNRIGMSVAGSEAIISKEGISSKDGISAEQMGMVYSAFLLFYTLTMLPGGWFIDRFGARVALMVLTFGSAIFVGLTAVVGFISREATTLWLGLLVVRSLLGIVNAPLHPAGAHVVFERVPRQSRAFANGLVTFGSCVGMVATYGVVGFLIDQFEWPVAFVASSGMTLAVAIIWTWGSRAPSSPEYSAAAQAHTTIRPADLLATLGRKSVVCLTLSYAALGYFQYLFFYWIEYFFETIQHEDKSVARGYTALIIAAMGVGMICGGWLSDRVVRSFPSRAARALVPVVGMIASGAVFELGLLAADPHVTLAAFAVAAALIGACEGAFWTTAVALGGRFGGATAGLMNTGGNLGGTISPYLTPKLGEVFTMVYGDDIGWRLSMAVAGVVVVAGAALWWGVGAVENETGGSAASGETG